jgi:glyoxylase-like metal-dependent hydrolase (beta-lactamase superfamily II)
MEIFHNIHLIPNVIANPYLLIDPSGLTLIDAGIPGSEKRILKYINDLGYKPTDLKNILVTHADFDHTGGLASLQRSSGALVQASEIEAKAIATGWSSRYPKPNRLKTRMIYALGYPFTRTTPVQVENYLKDGQVLDILGGLRVVSTSGHTPGHLSFFIPSIKVLFTGDSIVSDDHGLHRSVEDNTWDNDAAIQAVRRQAALDALIVCPGHGTVIRNASDKFPQL